MSRFRTAVENEDFDAVNDLLAEDVVFRSPVAHAPYPGKAITSAILRTVFTVFEDFHYVREIAAGDDEVLVFSARVDGLDITGADFIRLDAEGRIVEFTVMVRPLKAAGALAQAMAQRWEATQAAARGEAAPASDPH